MEFASVTVVAADVALIRDYDHGHGCRDCSSEHMRNNHSNWKFHYPHRIAAGIFALPRRSPPQNRCMYGERFPMFAATSLAMSLVSSSSLRTATYGIEMVCITYGVRVPHFPRTQWMAQRVGAGTIGAVQHPTSVDHFP
eukprot:SAG11_NODE_1534_length_4732_cov_1.778545_2_plen_139_part_00